jgi:NarL family two-component system response regulator LiaR
MADCKPIRILLVDDHQMVRDGLRTFLSLKDDLEIVAEASDGQEALDLCAQLQPDVILMDILMPGMDGPTATQIISTDYPDIQVIALTSFVEPDLVQRAIQAGAISYLLKDVRPERLAQAIRDACQGKGIIDTSAAKALVNASTKPADPEFDLTPREVEILALMVEGATNKKIAAELVISPGTTRFHISNILSKLGVSNRTEAASLALKTGLVAKT